MHPSQESHPTSQTPAESQSKASRFPVIVTLITITGNILRILIGSYALSVMAHLILRFAIGESWSIVAFLNTFAHLLWIPALFLLPLMLLARQWLIAILLVPPVLMFLFNYGGLYLSRSVDLPANAKHLTVLSNNVLAYNKTPHQSIEIIQAANADIVTLQEVSSDFAQLLETELDYPYKAIHSGGERPTMGQAVLSRYPIIEDDYWNYDWLPIPLGHQRVVIDLDGEKIVIYNAHPTHPGMANSFFDPSYRHREIEDLLERIRQETSPLIMIGDFNLTDLTEDYALITSQLIDSWREMGQGMGMSFPDFQSASIQDSSRVFPDFFPQHLPTPLFLRLDYAFHTEAFTAVEMYIWDKAGGSDHRPIFIEFALDEE